ncbi:hypothetical protein EG329_001560 [Mollisiaceae sp. DMI_Dod_QoI]|nr:hypothetical protein EG329_001560 [Helotiales sp. DMI_Dod_QoI]
MLRELLFQILGKHPALLSYFEPPFKRLAQQQRSGSLAWDLESLKECFFAIARQQDYPLKMCLFLDALDEHEGDNKELVRFVEELNPSVAIKICLASRPWPIFKTHFGQCLGIEVHLHTYHDILAYSQSRLEGSLDRQERDSSSKQLRAIANRVAAKALGVFVWVRIVINELSKGLQDDTPIPRLEQVVNQMPEELKDLYARTMTRIEPTYLLEGFAMLQVILCSRTPLTLGQLMRIIETSLLSGLLGRRGDETLVSFDEAALLQSMSLSNANDNSGDHSDSYKSPLGFTAMVRRLASRSGGLLEIVPGNASDADRVVQFLHQTVKEFARTYLPDGVTEPRLRTTSASRLC